MVEDLIRRARRRLILNESLAQVAYAAAIFAGGVAVVLILGTAFLSWWPLTLFALAGVGIGIYRMRLHMPQPYATAVRLDEKALLQDTLSTAMHFASHPEASAEFRRCQHEQATAAAGSVNLETAVPFTFPRALYAMAALCLLVSGLVAIRYRAGIGLDLRPPINEVFFEDQAAHLLRKPASIPHTRPGDLTDEAGGMLSKLGITPKPEGPGPGDPDALDKAVEQALHPPPGNQSSGETTKGSSSDKAAKGKDASGDNAQDGDPIDSGDKPSGKPNDNESGGNASKSDPGEKAKRGKQEPPKEGLLSKLKDAVSSLLSKKSEDKGSQPQGQPQTAQKDQRESDKKSGSQKDKPDQGNGDSDADDTDKNGDPLAGQQSKGKQAIGANNSQQQEGSGIGQESGSKDILAAEQSKAMGEISEIIGKRSTTVTGETSVEVQSGNQQLHTAYSKTNAAHAEADGDVTRDEIPLAVQAYVQQYFTEVRKSADAKK